MAVLIGSARHDERGKYSGGKAGDQTGDECSTQTWYLHTKGWVCIRAKDAAAREKIALNMEYACTNKHIGYDQGQNTTLYATAKKVGFDCSKVTTDCETDCARLVRVCVLYAGINCADFYTGNEKDALEATGAFKILTDSKYTTGSSYLLRGDILVTKTKGHTVVVLNDGSKANSKTHTTLLRGYKGEEVKELQRGLNQLGVKDQYDHELEVDGSFGARTKAAVITFQSENGLKTSGSCNQATWAALEEQLKTSGKPVRVKTDLNLRCGPAAVYKKLKVLKEGNTYTKLRESSGWFYLEEEAGWASGNYLAYK